jgi:hypothetical protein
MLVLGFVAASVIGGCDDPESLSPMEISGTSLISDPALVASVEEYYLAEEERDWATTYTLRPKLYQETVPFRVYVRDMTEDASGWHMAKVEIVSAIFTEKNRVAVTIKFLDIITEKTTAEKYDMVSKYAPEWWFRRGHFFGTEETQWIQEDDRWVALDAGTRFHMSLNDQIVGY